MNIHNDKKYGPRPKGYKSRNTAKPPRQREGKVYAGGKALRRAMARLARDTAFYEGVGGGKGSSKSQMAFTRPGSMKHY